MKDPHLSIIVPLYNMERFIESCLASLFNQDLIESEYEILVINDGSEDQSKEIAERFQKEHRNLFLVNKENQGVSVARNHGILMAKGRYLLFVDADDFIEARILKRIIKIAEEYDTDVLFLNLSVRNMDGKIVSENNYSDLQGKIISGPQAYRLTHTRRESEPDRVWGILFNKDFINRNNMLFLSDVPYLEDGHFLGKVLSIAGRCSFDNCQSYIHIINPNSVSRSNTYYTVKARNGFLKAATDLNKFLKRACMADNQRDLIRHLIAKYVISAVISSLGTRKLSEVIRVKYELRGLGFSRLDLCGLISNIRYARLYNISFWLFVIFFYSESRARLLKNIISRKNDIINY